MPANHDVVPVNHLRMRIELKPSPAYFSSKEMEAVIGRRAGEVSNMSDVQRPHFTIGGQEDAGTSVDKVSTAGLSVW